MDWDADEEDEGEFDDEDSHATGFDEELDETERIIAEGEKEDSDIDTPMSGKSGRNGESDEERPRGKNNKKQGEQMDTIEEEQEDTDEAADDEAEEEEVEEELVEGKCIETVLLNLF